MAHGSCVAVAVVPAQVPRLIMTRNERQTDREGEGSTPLLKVNRMKCTTEKKEKVDASVT